ncbi:MAG: hypothetical protein R3F60_12025 [bacterium]
MKAAWSGDDKRASELMVQVRLALRASPDLISPDKARFWDAMRKQYQAEVGGGAGFVPDATASFMERAQAIAVSPAEARTLPAP